jgi:biotin carboxylase
VGVEMKSIVFLGTNKIGSSYEGIKAAKRLGYETILLTNRSIFIENKSEYPEVDIVCVTNMSSPKDILELVEQLITDGKEIGCFISFLDDYVYLAALLTNAITNPLLTFEPLKIMTDKIATRTLLSDKSYTPFYRVLASPDTIDEEAVELKGQFPLIIKSPQSNGSKDVLLVNNLREFKKGVKKIHQKNPEQPILIEEFLQGPQYLVEVVVCKGNCTIVAIVEQEVTKVERFIITGYSIWPQLPLEMLSGLEETVQSIVDAFQLENGTCHLELKLTTKGWRLIEINPRMAGGAMNRMIEEAYGYNLAEQTIKLFLGEEPQFIRKQEKCIYTHYLIVDSIGQIVKIAGCDLAKKESGVLEVFTKARQGQIVTPPKSMGQRYGYVLATADSKEQAKRLAVSAAGQIQFYLQPL